MSMTVVLGGLPLFGGVDSSSDGVLDRREEIGQQGSRSGALKREMLHKARSTRRDPSCAVALKKLIEEWAAAACIGVRQLIAAVASSHHLTKYLPVGSR